MIALILLIILILLVIADCLMIYYLIYQPTKTAWANAFTNSYCSTCASLVCKYTPTSLTPDLQTTFSQKTLLFAGDLLYRFINNVLPFPGNVIKLISCETGVNNALVATVVVGSSTVLVILFKGTTTLDEYNLDVLTDQTVQNPNASCPMKSGVGIHQGFLEYFNNMSSQLSTAISLVPSPALTIVCGHSLGSAAAMILSSSVSGVALVNPVYYLLACPKVGNSAFQDTVPDSVFVVNNNDDIIPMLPLPIMANKAGTPFYYEPGRQVTTFSANYGSYTDNHSLDVYMTAMAVPSTGMR